MDGLRPSKPIEKLLVLWYNRVNQRKGVNTIYNYNLTVHIDEDNITSMPALLNALTALPHPIAPTYNEELNELIVLCEVSYVADVEHVLAPYVWAELSWVISSAISLFGRSTSKDRNKKTIDKYIYIWYNIYRKYK